MAKCVFVTRRIVTRTPVILPIVIVLMLTQIHAIVDHSFRLPLPYVFWLYWSCFRPFLPFLFRIKKRREKIHTTKLMKRGTAEY